MKSIRDATLAALLSTLVVFAAGCNGDASTTNTGDHDTEHADTEEHAEHDHPSHGPHDGDLIELGGGGEEYHAEILHSKEDGVVIYLLERDAKTAVPIDATEVTINTVHDGSPQQFKLEASADEGDPTGTSSRFSSADEELLGHLREEDAEAKLVVVIDGKQHRGKIARDHDHDHAHSRE